MSATEPRRHRLLMAFGLLLLAPTVGEYLLGNIPISQYGDVLVLVPLYGAGALLIRESARRLGRGWPTIALFAAAYALIEEGPVDQMIFNPGYLDLPSFAGYAEVPGLGISGSLVLWSLALHTVWSICVPIALVEAFDPTPTVPWLGRVGLTVTALLFVAGCVFLGVVQAHDLHFVGTPAQFVVTTVAIIGLVVAGLLVGPPPAPAVDDAGVRAPHPVVVAAVAFVLTSAYWLSTSLPVHGVPGVVLGIACFAAAVVLGVWIIRRWSSRPGWDGRHRLALAAGAAATYATWFGPSQAGEAGTGFTEAVWGAVVFGLAIALVVVAGARRQRRLAGQ
jgi:hypothetical protein